MDNLENENNNDVVENENNNENVVEKTEVTSQTNDEKTADAVAVEPEQMVIEVAYDDFDWDKGPKGVLNYSDDEIEQFEELYNSTLNSIKEYEIVAGKVVFITESDIYLYIFYSINTY